MPTVNRLRVEVSSEIRINTGQNRSFVNAVLCHDEAMRWAKGLVYDFTDEVLVEMYVRIGKLLDHLNSCGDLTSELKVKYEETKK